MRHLLPIAFLLLALRAAAAVEAADTTIVVDGVQVTAIKQGPVLRAYPTAATVVGQRAVERRRIGALKELSQRVPNFHAPDYGSRMTSSIYVRGLGARMDQPVVGLNVDNVPVLNKDCFDLELADIERIEVLRGPQSTLYGRNTMGGVVNVYTLSPLAYEGIRLLAEYGSGATGRLRASSYYKITPDLGMSVGLYYTRTGGFFENKATGTHCDWERLGGGRWKVQWDNRRGLRIDNTFACSVLDQGGYPYAYVGEELCDEAGTPILRPGQIAYNDPCGYRRTTLSDGLTVRYEGGRCSVSSITGYSYCDDEMVLDQDFTPRSYFTLRQARREHTLTEDFVVRSREGGRYGWLCGAFGFYRRGTMAAPVDFKRTGIEELILRHANASPALRYEIDADDLLLASDFRTPAVGAALYHESRLRLGRWRLTAGLRADCEHTRLSYRTRTELDYRLSIEGAEPAALRASIDESRVLRRSYLEILPKIAVMYCFDEVRNLYVSAAEGYKAGGFNTQLFSDLLQERLTAQMTSGVDDTDPGLMSYRPERSWNFEFGGRFSCAEGVVRGDFALFWIECRDQQLTVFPEGQSTGRMMTNAGRTRSRGAELAVQVSPTRTLDLDAAYGWTDARFRRYRSGTEDFRGRRIPYAPEHTLAAGATWTLPTGVAWLGDAVLHGGVRCAGPIYWNEANTRSQPFYALLDASVRLEHPRYSLTLWGRNLTDTTHDVFYFQSMGREFVQRGRPRTLGITVTLHIL